MHFRSASASALQNYIFQFVTRNFRKTGACYISLSDPQQMLKLWKLRSRATRSSGAYHIPIISCLSSVLFTWLSYGTTLDSLGALNRQIFAKTMHTNIYAYIHIYIHDPSPFSIVFWTPASRLWRSASVWINELEMTEYERLIVLCIWKVQLMCARERCSIKIVEAFFRT